MVVDHQPFEAVGVKIQLVQRFMMTVGMVQVAHQPLDAVVPVVAALQQVPVEAGVMVPLAALSELIAHKQQLFPREGEQPAVVGAQVGELLPGIARHAVENRFFAVHHFIVGERQHKVLGVVVEHAEGHFVMMVAAMHRIELHVIQGVVHPAEVPFEPETEAAAGWRTGHPGKIGGLFRHGDRARRLFAKDAVGVAQKLNGFQILPTAVFVGDPLSRLAAVIAIDHRGHRVDPQRIDAEAFDPVQRVTHQVVADFPTSVVVDQGIPVLVIPLARIAVLIQRSAVKRGKGKIIRREVAGHPVKNDVQPGGVRGIDKVTEIVAGAEAAGRRIEPGGLIAPAAVERVLVNRQ